MIISKYTWKWLLKNVKDGIFRNRDREIQKAKAPTVLFDTLIIKKKICIFLSGLSLEAGN